MKTLLRTAFVALLSVLETSLIAQEIGFELSVPNGIHRCVLIAQSEFTSGNVELISRRFLRENPGVRVLKLSIVTNRRDSAIALCGKCMYDYQYSVWLRLRRQWVGEHGPVAEMVAIRGNAVLRILDHFGEVKRIVLARGPALDSRGRSCARDSARGISSARSSVSNG